jgi:hypothetical protein
MEDPMRSMLALAAALLLFTTIAACERRDGTIGGMRTGGGTAGTPAQPSSAGPSGNAPSSGPAAPTGGPAAGTAGQSGR